eukprot:8168834-Pyramimonas_sp.AAC.1
MEKTFRKSLGAARELARGSPPEAAEPLGRPPCRRAAPRARLQARTADFSWVGHVPPQGGTLDDKKKNTTRAQSHPEKYGKSVP